MNRKKMVRKNILITDEQEAFFKKYSKEKKACEAEIFREILDNFIKKENE
jgi:hypothetical protein